MKPLAILVLPLLLALGGCEDERPNPGRQRGDPQAAEIARLRVDMERRVREARDEHQLRAARLRTIRIGAFVLLTGGAIAWFVHLHRPARGWPPGPPAASPRPQWHDHLPTRSGGRLIEVSPPDATPARIENHPPNRPPGRRRRRRGRHPHHPNP